MAKDSGMGTIIGLGVAGVGVWFVGNMFGWWGGGTVQTTTAPPTTPMAPGPGGIIPAGTPMPTSPPPAAPPPPASPPAAPPAAGTVSLAGPVTTTINNALQANVSINGQIQNLSVIPGDGIYNTAGHDISATLTPLGITAAQLYSMMQAAYTPASSTTPTPSTSPLIAQFNTIVAAYTVANAAGHGAPIAAALTALAAQIKAAGGQVPSNPVGLSGYRGMGARHNYVRKYGRFA